MPIAKPFSRRRNNQRWVMDKLTDHLRTKSGNLSQANAATSQFQGIHCDQRAVTDNIRRLTDKTPISYGRVSDSLRTTPIPRRPFRRSRKPFLTRPSYGRGSVCFFKIILTRTHTLGRDATEDLARASTCGRLCSLWKQPLNSTGPISNQPILTRKPSRSQRRRLGANRYPPQPTPHATVRRHMPARMS